MAGRMTDRHLTSVGIVGAGIVGLAVARQMAIQDTGVKIAVFEKEDHVAAHESRRKSGVGYAGVCYRPGSLKSRLCRRGAALLREFRQEHDVLYRQLGKLIVPSGHSKLPALASGHRRSTAMASLWMTLFSGASAACYSRAAHRPRQPS
jgi:(S)-2-hydroxyglutarate dehydrogenase